MSDYEAFFRDDPWANLDGPCYPQGHRLYLNDERFWVSIDNDHRHLFFIQDKGGGSIKPLENLAGLNISIEQRAHGECRLVCRITNDDPEVAGKFRTVAKDVAYYCSGYSGSQLFVKTQERIKSWANFLRPSHKGLSKSEFTGFFGELFALSEYVAPALDAETAVRAWIGPDGKKQDFTFDSIALEVKTSTAGNPNVIRITSLDQLDRVTQHLYLLRLMISPAGDGSGVCLSELYDNCLGAVQHNMLVESLFLQRAAHLYGKASKSQLTDRFKVTAMNIYEVRDDFPRLTRSDVSSTIVEASYQIAVSALAEYEITEAIGKVLSNG